jgi:hypothetical protein
MPDLTSFLPAELTEIGLAAAADPQFAERLIEALQRLPERADAARRHSIPVDGSAGVEASEPWVPA